MKSARHANGTGALPPDGQADLSRNLAAASLITLILLGLTWELWLAPLRPGGSWLVLKVLPLLAPLFGILRGRRHTYRWASLLIWLYFAEGCVRAWTDPPPGAWLGLAEILLSLLFFGTAAWYARNATNP
ncbi:MAG TPA: DUF2069 domain-containing protein [Thiobacillaceae bacterium]|nr:DUF2069 domain-containing protein [Thiobacillaceae bacterium]HNU64405.1 DUF2069 domain-containing protein [Thiobacillaceae bacterium]